MATQVEVPEKARNHLARWYGEYMPGQAVVLRGSLIGSLFGMTGQAAVTINRTIHLTPKASDLDTDRGIALLGHEMYHVLQQTELGWVRFLLNYLVGWRPIHIKEGWRHPMERPAYDRGREIRDSLSQEG
ncbi:MAG: DUF4157 domain-containing protein [SAR202 cluster bacterium]|jgi:hypothetical protein|nr:DUF4157 domain-containing protein [SAR202 cluster bacterium]MDP6514515.1 DUF4157 domain-containing protein [SAR202 cluster bacterium]MDP6713784.1 DUF4157 domain-containing protein [SAR202 cluster bacterium]